jgi:hypothetical protein
LLFWFVVTDSVWLGSVSDLCACECVYGIWERKKKKG